MPNNSSYTCLIVYLGCHLFFHGVNHHIYSDVFYVSVLRLELLPESQCPADHVLVRSIKLSRADSCGLTHHLSQQPSRNLVSGNLRYFEHMEGDQTEGALLSCCTWCLGGTSGPEFPC